jgi:hypothetical protein
VKRGNKNRRERKLNKPGKNDKFEAQDRGKRQNRSDQKTVQETEQNDRTEGQEKWR